MRGPKRVVAVIPARGGSTRIMRKNLAPLAGRPLLAHTVFAALGARELTAGVLVSTDNLEIAGVARSLGAKVINRPTELATATAPTEPALEHAVATLEAESGAVDAVVLLQATSPLRGSARIDEAVRLLLDTGCDSVVSVVADIGYYFLGDLGDDGRLRVGYDPKARKRTQDIAPRYRENGAIYVMSRRQLMEDHCRMGHDMRALVMTAEESVDIDDMIDLQYCESLLSARLRSAA